LENASGIDGESASFSLLLPGNRPGGAIELDTLWKQEVAGSNPVAQRTSPGADWRVDSGIKIDRRFPLTWIMERKRTSDICPNLQNTFR